MLLKAGADINKKNVVGLTALDMAKHRHLVRAIENLEAAAATSEEDHEQL